MSGNVVAIATSIAGLQIPGIDIRDLDALPTSVNAADCPLMTPNPSGPFMSGLQFERQSFGPGYRQYTLRYTLSYVLFYAPIGESTRLYDVYQDMVDAVMRVVVAFAEMETIGGATEILLRDVPHLEVVTDTTGKGFHGAIFALDVLEICRQGQ